MRQHLSRRLRHRLRSLREHATTHPSYGIAYDPSLLPSPAQMRAEGIDVLEEWFRWGEEWSMLLRIYGGVGRNSSVLEIGCGQGRTAFPLRYVLLDGSYDGFEIDHAKVAFLTERFHTAYPNFRFTWADVHNTFYNPTGSIRPVDFRFPYADDTFDTVYAASIFTHMLPEATARYFMEAARVLKPGGRCVFSCFVLDHYDRDRPRPLGFSRPAFAFDHRYGEYDNDFAIVVPENPERMTAYSSTLLERLATAAGLVWVQPPLIGFWSGVAPTWIAAQDLLVLGKPVANGLPAD